MASCQPETPGRDDLPDTLPFGYHHTDHALIISAPWRAAAVDADRAIRRLRADVRARDVAA